MEKHTHSHIVPSLLCLLLQCRLAGSGCSPLLLRPNSHDASGLTLGFSLPTSHLPFHQSCLSLDTPILQHCRICKCDQCMYSVNCSHCRQATIHVKVLRTVVTSLKFRRFHLQPFPPSPSPCYLLKCVNHLFLFCWTLHTPSPTPPHPRPVVSAAGRFHSLPPYTF